MIDLLPLVKETSAYRILSGDKKNGRISHSYLVVTADADNLGEYLKIFAKLLLCEEDEPCGKCRKCTLIDGGNFADAITYPFSGNAVLADDVNDLIEESYLKPIEGDRKVFLINRGETMTIQAQNKLLKTLEEPPENVVIIIGATTEHPLLPTIKSRVKRLDIRPFSRERLIAALKDQCPDEKKLNAAVSLGDGTVGKALSYYGSENLTKATELAESIIADMKSSGDVLDFSLKVSSSGVELCELFSVMELIFRDMLASLSGREDLVADAETFERVKDLPKYNMGAVIHALDALTEANKRKKFNANPTMLTEWVLFRILEGKYKWQKS